MTPAERLRAAATRLREVSGAATTGPWSVTREHLTQPEAGADVMGVDGEPVAADCCSYQGGCLPANADYIAMMHPPVALALADWLNALAQRAENIIDALPASGGVPDGSIPGWVEALAVADAVLGGERS